MNRERMGIYSILAFREFELGGFENSRDRPKNKYTSFKHCNGHEYHNCSTTGTGLPAMARDFQEI
jgi:hypothetical protein